MLERRVVVADASSRNVEHARSKVKGQRPS